MLKNRFKMLVAVYLILKKEDKILLHLRQNTGYADGYYSLVAGHVNGNETVIQAMVREAKEETGIDIHPDDLKVAHIMHRLSNHEYIDIFISCKHWSGDITNLEPRKCGELLFAPVTNLPENTLPHIKTALMHITSGQIFSEIGL